MLRHVRRLVYQHTTIAGTAVAAAVVLPNVEAAPNVLCVAETLGNLARNVAACVVDGDVSVSVTPVSVPFSSLVDIVFQASLMGVAACVLVLWNNGTLLITSRLFVYDADEPEPEFVLAPPLGDNMLESRPAGSSTDAVPPVTGSANMTIGG